MALIDTGETLCSTDTLADRLLPAPELRSIAAVRNRLLCDGGGGGGCCCAPALVMIEGDDRIEGECRSSIEWAAFWITWLADCCWMIGLDRLADAFSSCSPDRWAICWYKLEPGGICPGEMMFGVLPLLLLLLLLLDWLFNGALLFELGLLLVAVELLLLVLLLLVGRFIPGTVAVDRGTDTTRLGVCG